MFAKKKSLESILSTFTKTVEDLKVLQQSNQEDIKRYNNQILSINVLKELAEEESARAKCVESKLNSLLN